MNETKQLLRERIKTLDKTIGAMQRQAHYYRERLRLIERDDAFDWPLEQEALADVLLRLGYRPREVATWIGRTRSAVIGKAHRRGWQVNAARPKGKEWHALREIGSGRTSGSVTSCSMSR